MNVYDTANRLAQEIRQSEEYKKYKEMKDIVDRDPTLKKEVEEFEKLRYELQVAAMQGEELQNEKGIELQQMYAKLASNTDIKEYFDLQIQFNIMIADVNKIIAESVKDLL